MIGNPPLYYAGLSFILFLKYVMLNHNVFSHLIDNVLVMHSCRHISMHISGEDSVFSFMPSRVTTTSFDIDDKLDSQLRHRSRRFMTLVPPMQSTHEGRRRHSTHDGQLGSTSSQNRQKFPSIVEPLDHEVRDILWSMFV